jgi:membrane associated rhomboid family serine protease
MLRSLIDDFQEFPATMTFCALWVVVFALMVLEQVIHGPTPTLGKVVLGIQGGHPFGDLTLNDLFQGEIWRPLTATFVHYGLIHLGLNLFGMYQLGALAESWYGPWQFVAVYVAIGYGGNLLSALARHALGSDPRVASGGGSTVLLGLIALCAVVGWRSRTRFGAYVRSQMVWLLIATALLGLIVPIVDNWGHACGALIGALIGFAHRILIRTTQRPAAKVAGAVGVLALVAAAAAQIRDDRDEARHAAQWQGRLASAARRVMATESSKQALQEIGNFYLLARKRSLFDHMPLIEESLRHLPPRPSPKTRPNPKPAPAPAPATPRPAEGTTLSYLDSPDEAFRNGLKRELERLDALKDELGNGPTAADFRRLRAILARVLDRPPSEWLVREFFGHLNALLRRAQQDQEAARAQIESLQQQARLGYGVAKPSGP